MMIAASALLLTVGAMAAGPGGEVQVNTEKSSVHWLGKKATGQHEGNVSLKSGTIHMHGDVLESVSVVMDMTSITCTDIEDATYNKKLVGHLNNEDFFNTKVHPEATFNSTKIERIKDAAGNDGVYAITGDLTIKGITHPVTFNAQVDNKGDLIMAAAKATFDRSKYDIKYNSGSFFENLGDKVIYDDVELNLKLVANLK